MHHTEEESQESTREIKSLETLLGILHQPAGHEHGTVRPQLHVSDHQGGVRQDLAATQLVQVQQHVVGVAGELLHVSLSRLGIPHLDPVDPQDLHNAGVDLRRTHCK